MALEVKLKAQDLKLATAYDEDSQSVVAKIAITAKVGGGDIMTLAQLQTYPYVDCVLSSDQLTFKMEVDKETGEIPE